MIRGLARALLDVSTSVASLAAVLGAGALVALVVMGPAIWPGLLAGSFLVLAASAVWASAVAAVLQATRAWLTPRRFADVALGLALALGVGIAGSVVVFGRTGNSFAIDLGFGATFGVLAAWPFGVVAATTALEGRLDGRPLRALLPLELDGRVGVDVVHTTLAQLAVATPLVLGGWAALGVGGLATMASWDNVGLGLGFLVVAWAGTAVAWLPWVATWLFVGNVLRSLALASRPYRLAAWSLVTALCAAGAAAYWGADPDTTLRDNPVLLVVAIAWTWLFFASPFAVLLLSEGRAGAGPESQPADAA